MITIEVTVKFFVVDLPDSAVKENLSRRLAPPSDDYAIAFLAMSPKNDIELAVLVPRSFRSKQKSYPEQAQKLGRFPTKREGRISFSANPSLATPNLDWVEWEIEGLAIANTLLVGAFRRMTPTNRVFVRKLWCPQWPR